MILFLKAKAAAPGEVRTHKDGRKWRKMGKRWVYVPSAHKAVAKVLDTAESHYSHAILGSFGKDISDILGKHGVMDFDGLTEKIKTGKSDVAHKMYKDIVDHIIAAPGERPAKQAAIHLIGTSLVKLRDQLNTAKKPTTYMQVKSSKGKEYFRKEKISTTLPLLKPSVVLAAKKKMGGWVPTGKLESKHVREMLANGTATLVSGKVDAKKSWVMPDRIGDITLKYTGDSLILHVKQVRSATERTRAISKVDIALPYAFSKAFILKHIERVRTRNTLIFKLEMSKGYKLFLEKAVSK